MNFLEFFFSGFSVGCLLALSIWLVRLGVRWVKAQFDSPAWVDD